jgi:IstB-like ATP binding protein
LFTHPTLDQLHQLGLAGMARAFVELEANPTSAALSHAEWLGLLLDREITERYEKRLRASTTAGVGAKFAVSNDFCGPAADAGGASATRGGRPRGQAAGPRPGARADGALPAR